MSCCAVEVEVAGELGKNRVEQRDPIARLMGVS